MTLDTRTLQTIMRRIGETEVSLPHFIAVYGITVVVFATALGSVHDYQAYERQWRAIVSGGDSWAVGNAYGPLHNVFAYLYWIWPLLPKLVFAVCGVLCAYLLLLRLSISNKIRMSQSTLGLLATFPLNPLLIISTYVYGQNDIICAIFILLSFKCRDRGQLVLAGICIGFAALEKYYPILFAAFLMMDKNKLLHLRLLFTSIVVFLIGSFVSYLYWGPKVFWPLMLAAKREAKMLSIYRFFQCHPQFIGGESVFKSALDANSFVMAAVCVASFLVLYLIGATWRTASTLGVLAIFATYSLGHSQFYVAWIVAVGWLITEQRAHPEYKHLADVLAPAVVYIALFQLAYLITGTMTKDWAFLRCYVSPPFLLIVGICLVMGLRSIWQKPQFRVRLRW